MPQELLRFPPIYLTVGIYRLTTDHKIQQSIWKEFSKEIKKLTILSTIYFIISFPITKIWVKFFLLKNINNRQQDSNFFTNLISIVLFKFSLLNFITISLVLGQINYLLNLFLIRKIKKTRSKVYNFTIESRAKEADFWIPYVEEWEHPPIEKAQRKLGKVRWYKTITGPIFRLVILKVLLLPLSFVPFLNTIVGSFLASLTLAEKLLEPYFEIKKMSELQRAIFVVERQNDLRWLGFFAAILEKIPILGILFSISNRIAIAMYAHDLEKHQHLVTNGLFPKRSLPYISKSLAIQSDLPPDAVGNFPKKNN